LEANIDKMKVIKFYFLLSIFAISCNQYSLDFEVYNHSKDDISDIIISASGSTKFETLDLNENQQLEFKLDMSDCPITDGNYKIEFKRNGIIHSESFGYYTNGSPVNDLYTITILNKGIEIKEN